MDGMRERTMEHAQTENDGRASDSRVAGNRERRGEGTIKDHRNEREEKRVGENAAHRRKTAGQG